MCFNTRCIRLMIRQMSSMLCFLNLFCEWITDWPPCIQAALCVYAFYCSDSSSWDIFSRFSEGKVINRSLSRASDLSAVVDWNLSLKGWKQKSTMGAGSHNRFWLRRTADLADFCHYSKRGIHTSCLKVFYKSSCWEETWRSDLEYFSPSLLCLWKAVCSISKLTSCADSGRQWGLQTDLNTGPTSGISCGQIRFVSLCLAAYELCPHGRM